MNYIFYYNFYLLRAKSSNPILMSLSILSWSLLSIFFSLAKLFSMKSLNISLILKISGLLMAPKLFPPPFLTLNQVKTLQLIQ